MTATYWEIRRRIVEFEQGGKKRAEYGEELLNKLAADLTARFGRGFSAANLFYMRKFFLGWPAGDISQTVSVQSTEESTASLQDQISQRMSVKSGSSGTLERLGQVAGRFALPWSHYVRLMALSNEEARRFYETEALRCGWSVRQLLELDGDFAFIGRQRRPRIDDEWYRIDLLFFHRKLRCLIILDLKLGRFDPADAGQMHLYLNYAKEHWMHDGENPPVGVILCAQKAKRLPIIRLRV